MKIAPFVFDRRASGKPVSGSFPGNGSPPSTHTTICDLGTAGSTVVRDDPWTAMGTRRKVPALSVGPKGDGT